MTSETRFVKLFISTFVSLFWFVVYLKLKESLRVSVWCWNAFFMLFPQAVTITSTSQHKTTWVSVWTCSTAKCPWISSVSSARKFWWTLYRIPVSTSSAVRASCSTSRLTSHEPVLHAKPIWVSRASPRPWRWDWGCWTWTFTAAIGAAK